MLSPKTRNIKLPYSPFVRYSIWNPSTETLLKIPENTTSIELNPDEGLSADIYGLLDEDDRVINIDLSFFKQFHSYDLCSITFDCYEGLKARQLTNITHLKGLNELFFRCSSGDVYAPYFRFFPQLTSLTLECEYFTDRGMKFIGELPRLKTLCIFGCPITDHGAKHIQKLKELEWLNLHRTSITDITIRNLVGLPKLKELFLSGASITDTCLAYLESYPSIEKVHLYDTNTSEMAQNKLLKTISEAGRLKREVVVMWCGEGWYAEIKNDGYTVVVESLFCHTEDEAVAEANRRGLPKPQWLSSSNDWK